MDSICLAMILRLRKYILNRDQNDCFSLLFKYPKIDNIKNIIILAYNIHQIILQKKNGKNFDSNIILNIVNSFKEDEKNIIINNNSNINKIKVYSTNDIDKKFLFGNYNHNFNNKNEENNINNNIYEETSFFDGAMSSLGKIGNIVKDQLKVAKDAMLGFDLNYNKEGNNEFDYNNKKESKMVDLFDLPKKNEIKEEENNNQEKNNNKIINIIKRLEKLDNKYNKYFDTEDKNELKNIIIELSK